MSCSIITLPFALAWVVGTVISSAVQNKAEKEANQHVPQAVISDISEAFCDDVQIISEATLLERKLETPFMDKEILIKTLEEHGVVNIVEEQGRVRGEIDTYSLEFEKFDIDKPYTVVIKCLEKDDIEEKMKDLNSEYALNVQEDAYLNIVEKLKENNMQIEEEEVLDDNTIVLTVNIE